MSSGKVKCTCGWSWNKSDSSKKDMYICHECGRDNSNNMRNGGWLDNYNDSETSVPEGYVGEGYDTTGRNYSPAWGGQFEDGGELIPMAQKGKKVKYVKSKNDPRYKAYQDSLSLYNNYENNKNIILKGGKYYPTIEKSSPYTFNKTESFYITNPNNPLVIKRAGNDFSYAKIGDKGNPKITVKTNKKIQPIQTETFTRKESRLKSSKEYDNASRTMKSFSDSRGKINWVGYDIQKYKKPEQEIRLKEEEKEIVVQPDLPRVEAINLPPMQQLQSINPPAISDVVRSPKSYNVSAQRYHMQGPSDYYNYNQENVDYETAMKVKAASDAYNKNILKRYGPQNEYRTPKSAKEAAERLKQLRSEFEMTPNYQMGGSVYPVNYVPEAQMGASIPGAVGFTYARTNDPAPSNGPYAKKTKASAQDGAWLDNYDVAQDGKWLGNKLDKQGYITSETKGGNRISFTGNQRADEWINKQIDSGKFGFDPKTGGTFPLKKPVKGLSKEDQFMATEQYNDLQAPEGFNTEYQLAQIKKLPQYQQDIINDSNKQRRQNYVEGNMEEVVKHPLWSPGYFTPEGAIIGALQGATKMGPDLYEGDYKAAAMDALMMLPLAPGVIKTSAKALPKIKTFAKGAASDIKFTADQIGDLNRHIKSTRPYVDQSLAHINDVRRIPEHMSTVATRDDLIHQLNYLQDDLRATYQSASGYRATPEQIDRAVGDWQKYIVDKLGGREGLSSLNPAMSDPAHIQNLYNNILDNLPNAKEIEKFGVSALKTARREQIFNPSTDIEKIKTFAKSIGKKSDDVSEITISPKEQETINAVRELGKYRNMIGSDMNAALSHQKTLQNLNQLILKLDDDVVQSIVGVPKAELLNRYKNMVPLDIREGVKDIISNPISTNELRSVPSSYTTIDPAIQKLNTGYSDSSLFSKLGKRYYEMDSPYNIEEMASLPKSMIKFARTDKYLKAKYDWDNSLIGYEDDVFTSGNTTGQLRDALNTVEAAPKGQNFVGSSSLSTDSFPLTLDSGMFMMKKGIVEPKFSGELMPLNPMGTTNQLPNLSLKEINFKIQELEKLSGKKIPRAKIVNGEYKVPEIYFTKLKKGGVIKDDLGQWAHPGEITEIGSNQITMQGIPYDVLGISDEGDAKLMKPGKNYKFKGKKVTEYPMAKNGLRQEQKGLVNLDQLTNFTNYNTKQPGGWLDKY